MEKKECSRGEDIVRAIRSSHWDESKQRWSSDLFRGPHTSVSRLRILSLSKIFDIFLEDLHRPPVHRVVKAGQIKVGNLIDLGLDFQNNGKPAPRKISVEEAPIEGHPEYTDNPAHAEIPQKLPRTLAFQIINRLELHNAPPPYRKLWRALMALLFVTIAAALWLLL